MSGSILSVRGAAALAERRVRIYGAVAEPELVRWLERIGGVHAERAQEAINLACLRCRLTRETRDDGEMFVRRPIDWRAEA